MFTRFPDLSTFHPHRNSKELLALTEIYVRSEKFIHFIDLELSSSHGFHNFELHRQQ